MMQWFAVSTYSSQELAVKKRIEQMVEREGLQEKIGQVLVPQQEYITVKDGKRKTVKANLFPSYIIIEMELDSNSQYMVQSIQGVVKFIGEGNDPHPLRKSEVERLLGVVNAEDALPKIEIPYVNGDSVRIKEGPFKDFIGTVEEVNTEKRKLKAMVSVFGRSTPVELGFTQVEAVSASE
jgi:transcriptional antiterminator NusG